jgi:inner membrane protein
MDNACHTLCALAMARLGLDRLGPRATLAVVVASNLPDVDSVVALFGGKSAYLVHHRGLSHSVAGLFAQAILVALLLARWPRRAAAARPASFARLCLAAAAGAASHLLLDGLNSYGIRPWLPFLDRWFFFDVAFVIDPFLWLGFGLAAMLGGRANRAGDALWILWTLAAALFLWLAGRSELAPIAWFALVLGMAAALLVRRGRLPGPRGLAGAWLGAALAAAYLAMLAWLGSIAGERASAALAAAGFTPQQIVANARMPRPAHPFVFEVVVATADATVPVAVDVLAGTAKVGRALPRNLDERLLERLRQTREYMAWRVFARLPVVRDGERQGSVRLGDARFEVFGRQDWSALEVDAPR